MRDTVYFTPTHLMVGLLLSVLVPLETLLLLVQLSSHFRLKRFKN